MEPAAATLKSNRGKLGKPDKLDLFGKSDKPDKFGKPSLPSKPDKPSLSGKFIEENTKKSTLTSDR